MLLYLYIIYTCQINRVVCKYSLESFDNITCHYVYASSFLVLDERHDSIVVEYEIIRL